MRDTFLGVPEVRIMVTSGIYMILGSPIPGNHHFMAQCLGLGFEDKTLIIRGF